MCSSRTWRKDEVPVVGLPPPVVAQWIASRGHALFPAERRREEARFRTWADMPTARRISDARVKSWTAAGKP